VKQSGSILLVVWTVLVAVVLMLVTSWWLGRNDLPNGFQNEADHLYTLSEAYFRLRDNSYSDAHDVMWGEYYPPMNHVVAMVGMTLFGRSREVATLSLGSFAVFLLIAVAFIGRRVRGSPTAALAVGLVAVYPAVFGNMRRYEPNIVLTGLVALAMALLIADPLLRRRRVVLLLGIVAGLGLLCDRVVFAIYLLPPTLALLVTYRSQAEQRASLLKGLAIALGVAMLGSGYYYGNFLTGHLDEILTQLSGEVDATGLETAIYSPLSLRGLLYYPLSWIDCQMGPALAGVTGLGLGLYAWKGRRTLDQEPRVLLEAWLVGGLVVLTMVGKKQPFYSIPILAPAAILAAVGWSSLRARSLRAVVAAVVLLLSIHQLLFLTQHRGLAPSPGRWAWLAGASPFPAQWLGYEYTQAAAPFEQNLRLDEAVDLCQGVEDPNRPYTLLFSEGGAAEEGQLMPTLRLALDTRLVEGVRKSPPEAIAENLSNSSCFFYVGIEGRHWPSAASVGATMDRFNAGDLPDALISSLEDLRESAELLGSWMSIGGEEVHVYALGGEISRP
jgi:hypothetical protein